MRNLLIILISVLAFSASYGQDTKPSKQETMDWIAGKLKETINSKYSIFRPYNQSIFNYSEPSKEWDDEFERETLFYFSRYIDLNKVTKSTWFVKGINDSTLQTIAIEGNNLCKVVKVRYSDQKVMETEYENKIYLCPFYIKGSDGNDLYYETAFNINTDYTLPYRMRKALENLVSYNTGKKEGETY